MRARSNLGFLPDLVLDAIPSAARERVSAAVIKVVDGAHRSSGITVVDLCRDAMGVILSAHLHLDAGEDAKVIEKDLGALIAKLPPESKLFRAAADVVCKLHPRASPMSSSVWHPRRHGRRWCLRYRGPWVCAS